MDNDNLTNELKVFKSLCIILKNKCLLHKKDFKGNSTFTTLSNIGETSIRIYFSDNHKTWSLDVDKLSYNHFKNDFDLPIEAIDDIKYVSKMNKLLLSIINKFDDKYHRRARKLIFD